MSKTTNEDLKFINDSLYELTGMSDSSTVHFIGSLASNVKNYKELAEKLTDFGLCEDKSKISKFNEFTYELYHRTHREENSQKTKAVNPEIKKIEEGKRTDLPQKTYDFIYEEEPIQSKSNIKKIQYKPKKVKEKEHINLETIIKEKEIHQNQRKEEKATTTVNIKEFKEESNIDNQNSSINELNSIEDPELMELMMEKDKLERDLLDQKIKAKNKEQESSKNKRFHTSDLEQKYNITEVEKEAIGANLRRESRFSFLKQRVEQQLEIFKRRIDEENKLFSNVQLTESEYKLNELNQNLLRLVNEKLRKEEKREEYNFPSIREEKDMKALSEQDRLQFLTKKFKETQSSKLYENDDDDWEKTQKKKNLTNYGSSDRYEIEKIKNKHHKDNYSLIMENQVQFVKGEAIKGLKKKYKKIEKEMKKEKKKQKKEADEDSGSNEEEISNYSRGTKEKILLQLKEEITSQYLEACGDRLNFGKNVNTGKSISAKIDLKESPLEKQKQSLPIYAFREKLLEAVRDYQVLVIVGETGSGKTTQIPQYLHEIGYSKLGKIGITQPRRVAAMSVATRVSQEVGCRLGSQVGYSIRFDDCHSNETKIKYLTDGMLLKEILIEPDLKSYSVIMIDEAHERTLHTDIILALIKDIGKYRKDLKILISSATMDAQMFSEYFNNCPIFKIPGRTFEVETMYSKAPEADYIEASVNTVLQIHMTYPKGDILVFLTGQEEIEVAQEMLIQSMRRLGSKVQDLLVLPIYSALPSEQQAKIFLPTPENCRKVVLATNIAETSITIDGIVYVVDCGFCKQLTFSARTRIESLVVTPISQASANQRAGRAGRTCPGICFRLYTSKAFEEELESDNIPEIKRSNLISTVLMLKSLGINDLLHFDFITKPPEDNFIKAFEQLFALGALNKEGDLTKTGRKMAEFPMNPLIAKMIIKAEYYECLDHVISIAAMLSIGSNIFYSDKRNPTKENIIKSFHRPGGDHFTLLNVFKEFSENGESGIWCKENFIHYKSMVRAKKIKEQIKTICEKVEIYLPVERPDLSSDNYILNMNIRKCICSGFFFNAAKFEKEGVYRPLKINSITVRTHPSSSLFKDSPQYVVYNELVFTTTEYMRDIIEINYDWLLEVAPHYFKNFSNNK